MSDVPYVLLLHDVCIEQELCTEARLEVQQNIREVLMEQHFQNEVQVMQMQLRIGSFAQERAQGSVVDIPFCDTWAEMLKAGLSHWG